MIRACRKGGNKKEFKSLNLISLKCWVALLYLHTHRQQSIFPWPYEAAFLVDKVSTKCDIFIEHRSHEEEV